MKYPVMDHYLNWRLKELVKEGKLEVRGEMKSLKITKSGSLAAGRTEAPAAEENA